MWGHVAGVVAVGACDGEGHVAGVRYVVGGQANDMDGDIWWGWGHVAGCGGMWQGVGNVAGCGGMWQGVGHVAGVGVSGKG